MARASTDMPMAIVTRASTWKAGNMVPACAMAETILTEAGVVRLVPATVGPRQSKQEHVLRRRLAELPAATLLWSDSGCQFRG